MLAQSDLVPNESAIAKALDYSLKRWKRWMALTRYLTTGLCPLTTTRSIICLGSSHKFNVALSAAITE